MRNTISVLLLSSYLFLFHFLVSCGDGTGTPFESAQSLWNEEPEQIRSLIQRLDMTKPALSNVAGELSNGDTIAACHALLNYYKNADRKWVIDAIDPMDDSVAAEIVHVFNHDSIIIHEVKDVFPVTSTGGFKWDHLGPHQDAEFAYSLNAQSYVPAFYIDYQNSENEENIKTYNRLMQDWVLQHDIPLKDDSIYLVLREVDRLDYRDINEYEWRTLDAGRRLGAAWPQTFYGFQQHEAFSPATRLLMLNSMATQSDYLMEYHKRGHNWTTMEMNGLALVGLAFPEFKNSEEWANYALDVMEKEINRQVYPDGVQTEISSKTQWVALRRFESLARNFQRAGREISREYLDRVEEMYDFLAYSMRPDGHQALNNDSDREDLRPRVINAALQYDRPDWVYIATNGKEGEKPQKGPSVSYPWAGIQVWRNGWDLNSDWTFFDHGPYGTGHQHRDKLHISIAAFGHDLLVDGGRYTHQDYFSFDPSVWRGYFRSSFSHNVLLVNGHGQNAGQIRADKPLEEGIDFVSTPQYDYARGTFNRGYGEGGAQVTHHRSVLYLKNHVWLVVDRMEAEEDTEFEALWHFSPECEVEVNGIKIHSVNKNRPNVAILPLGNMKWSMDMVQGQESPFYQGWYSFNYGHKEPNPTAVYKGTTGKTSVFGWLIVAENGQIPSVDVDFNVSGNRISCVIDKPGEKTVTINGQLDKPESLSPAASR